MAIQPKTVDVQSDAERMQAAIDDLRRANAELTSRVTKAEDRAEEAETELSELEEMRMFVGEGGLRDLAKARTAFYEGDKAEGLYKLERVLDELDNAWRTLA